MKRTEAVILTTVVALLAASLTGALLARGPAANQPGFPVLTTSRLLGADFTLYFVNSGAANTEAVGAGDQMGLYQSVSDQQYGPDKATGASWGYVVDSVSNPVPYATSCNAKEGSLRYDQEPTGANLPSRQVEYDFDVPDGTYDVTFGFKLPTSWGSRPLVLAAEDHDLGTVTATTRTLEKTYPVSVSDGKLDLAVKSPADRTQADADPMVSYIEVKAPTTYSTVLLQTQIDRATLPTDQTVTYGSAVLARLRTALAAGKALVDAHSQDTAAIKTAYNEIGGAYAALLKSVSYSSFRPGAPWSDSSGKTIQAHGGQVVTAKDDSGRTIYYWYGEDRSNGIYSSPGIHVYSSYDLYNWKDQGLALRAMTTKSQFDTDAYFQGLYGGYTTAQKDAVFRDLSTTQTDPSTLPAVLERPKVIYNAKTGEWVMWVHADGPTATSNVQYAKAQAGVAVSKSPFGPFRYIDSYRLDVAPAGEQNYKSDDPGMSRDMNLFVDDDGTAYIVYSSEDNLSTFISKLDDDYTQLATAPAQAVKGVDFTRPYVGGHREAPALFKRGGVYYLVTSGATGWDPNPASYATASTVLGSWTDRGNPISGTGAATADGSQATAVIPVDAAAGTFIYMGDRWTPADLGQSPYVWLPMSFDKSGALSIGPADPWKLAGLVPTTPQASGATAEHGSATTSICRQR